MKTVEKTLRGYTDVQRIRDAVPEGISIQIDLVYTSYTGGHRSAAESVKELLDKIPGINTAVVNIHDNIEREMGKKIRSAINSLILKKLHPLRSWFFRGYFTGDSFIYRMSNFFIKIRFLAKTQFLNRIREQNIDGVLSCNSDLNSVLSWWKSRGLLKIPVHSLITDFRAHRLWVQDHIDRYYVACQRTRDDLIAFGVPPEKIIITGIPIKEKFYLPSGLEKKEMKKKLGLDKDLFLVVMVGGALGLGPYEEVARTLNRTSVPVQCVFITGKNHHKKNRLMRIVPFLDIPVRVLEYVDNMDEWIEASDVMITKPGGLSVTEIIVKDRPMLRIRGLGCLEEAQAEYLDKITDGFFTINLSMLNETVQRICNNHHQNFYTSSNTNSLYNRSSATDIAWNLVYSAVDGRLEDV